MNDTIMMSAEKLSFLSSLEENDRTTVIDSLLPGIKTFLEEILNKECLTDDVQCIRENYVSILNCVPSQESKERLRKQIASVKKQKQEQGCCIKEELITKKASSKLGQVRERKLINIRQFKVNQKKLLSSKMSDVPVLSTTDDEDRMIGDEHFVEISKSEKDLLCSNLSNITSTRHVAVNGSYLFLKNNDGLRRRWCFIEDGVLKCCKRQNHSTVVHEMNLKDDDYSAIQGRLGKMYAISLSNANDAYLFATGNSELCASWLISFNEAGVHLQDDLLRNVTINKQNSNNNNNNNKVSWLFPSTGKSSADVFRSDLLEALELIERSSRAAHILPKRTSYSFKELDVLKKLKASLVAKRSENKLNRRKTWSAGSFPNIAIIERFRKTNSVTENDISTSEKNDVTNEPQEASLKQCSVKRFGLIITRVKSLVVVIAVMVVSILYSYYLDLFTYNMTELLASSSSDSWEYYLKKICAEYSVLNAALPEILTSSGVVKNEGEKEREEDLGLSMENMDHGLPHTAQDEPSFVKSMPEGLNEPQSGHVRSPLPRSSNIAQSVPDLLLRPPSMDMSSKTARRGSKTNISLTRVMSSKATSVKNAIITGLRRKGRRSGGAGRVTIDWHQAEIYGALYRKKGNSWKQRWCVVLQSTMYAFRDSSYHHEEFRCDLHKLIALRSGNSPGRAHTFKIVRRKGEEITLAAESKDELEKWMTVLQKTMTKPNLLVPVNSRSSSLTPSYMSADTYQDSSAAEDTLTDQEKSESNYCETTDKDSSDETSSASFKMRPRGISERGYMYHLVREDTWEHCWVEVIFGVLSVYNSEKKETVLQRERIALYDLKSKENDGDRLYSFSLKRQNRPGIYLEVDNETDFQRWSKCFSSWLTKQEDGGEDADVTNIDFSHRNFIPKTTQHLCDEATPNTSDSDSCYLEATEMNRETGERPLRRAMTNVLQQLTPPVVRRRYKSSAGVIETQCKNGAVKTSFLYFKANSGLWVKYWCILESFVIYCYNSPEEPNPSFSVNVQGCEIRRTSHKDKNYTFEVFDRAHDKHFEFAGETTYIMYSWMRVLKIHAGLINKKDTTSENNECGDVNGPISSIPAQPVVTSEETKVEAEIIDERTVSKDQDVDMTSSSVTPQPVTSPKRSKTKITSLDEVLKLLHEKTLQQQLQNKDHDSSNRMRLKWKYAMLVALRKTRSQSASDGSPKRSTSDSTSPPPELNEKSAKVKSHEISQKYDHLLDDERLKMLRRETLLKKRRNSLILRKDILERKLGKNVETTGKNQTKKRYSKIDSKSDPVKQLSQSNVNEVKKQLDSIKLELESIHANIQTNMAEQKKIGEELNEQKRKELHELRLTVDQKSPQHSKSNLQEHYSLANRRQHSDSTLTFDKTLWETTSRKLSAAEGDKFKVNQTSNVAKEDLRKTMSFSTPNRLVTAKSSPLLRTQTLDNALRRPMIKSRSSQEAMSLALSQIEDFEQFVQDF